MTTPKPTPKTQTKLFVTFKDLYRFANNNKELKINLESSTECLIALTLRAIFRIECTVVFCGSILDANVVDTKTGNVVFKSKAFNKMYNALYLKRDSMKTGAELCVLLRKYSGKSHKYLMS